MRLWLANLTAGRPSALILGALAAALALPPAARGGDGTFTPGAGATVNARAVDVAPSR